MKVKCKVDRVVDLVKGRSYEQIPDARTEESGYIRVIDESGEDYCYPRSWFRSATPERQDPMRATDTEPHT